MENNIVRPAIYAGLIAGLAMLVIEMILIALFTVESVWGVPRMMAAIIMGRGVVEPATFNLGIILVGMIVHFALSIIYALIFGYASRLQSLGSSVTAGAFLGLILYVVNFFIFAPLFFEWFIMARNWIQVVGHLAFGITLGYSYFKIHSTYEAPTEPGIPA